MLLYRSGFAAQHTWYKVIEKQYEEYGYVAKYGYKKEIPVEYLTDDYKLEKEIEVEPFENAAHNVRQTLGAIISATGSDDYTIYLTGDGNYRESVATILPYKGNRDPTHKPYHYNQLKELFIEDGAVLIEGMEADDAMSMEQYKANLSCAREYEYMCREYGQENVASELEYYNDTIICTVDKDLDMVPGYHYNWVRDEKYWIDEVTGLRNFYKQLLQGDKTDNIPGLYNITGTKCTKKILEPLDTLNTEVEMWEYVTDQYVASWADITVIDKVEEIAKLLWMSKEKPNDWKRPDNK